jgi:hypothetical protein
MSMVTEYEHWNDVPEFSVEEARNYYADCEAMFLCSQCGRREWADALTGEPKCCDDGMIETSATRTRTD